MTDLNSIVALRCLRLVKQQEATSAMREGQRRLEHGQPSRSMYEQAFISAHQMMDLDRIISSASGE